MDTKKMTTYNIEELQCPKCGQIHALHKYEVINATEKPDIKEDILKNRLFCFTCEQCGHTAPVTYESLYLDSRKKLMILLLPENSKEIEKRKKEWERESIPVKRIVDNINDLKEKIIIGENGLDDRVIELMKITYLRQLEREMYQDTLMNILFDYKEISGQKHFCFVVFFEKKGIGTIPIAMEYYRQTEERFRDKIKTHSNAAFMKVDMEWAGDIIFQKN